MGKPRIAESPLRPHDDPSATRSLGRDSGSNGGGSGEGRADKARLLTLLEGSDMSTTKQLLVETMQPIMLELVEARNAPGSGRMVARGEYGRCDVPTLNGRIYSKRLMEREIKRLSEDLENRRVLGQLDHPQSGKSSLALTSHVITALWIEPDGRVMGEAEILNTTSGRDLRALVEARIPVPVSSRGFGSTKSVTEGEQVQDDFILKTYDFVADPAVRTAVPTITMESVEDVPAATLAEQFLTEFPEVARQIQEAAAVDAVERAKGKVTAGVDAAVEAAEKRVRAEMTEAFESKLAVMLVEAREDLSSQLREEYAVDPAVGGAKAMLAHIAEMVGVYAIAPDERTRRDAQKAADLAVAEAQKARDAAVEEAHQARMALIVEQEIGSTPVAKALRGVLQGVHFQDEADVRARLAALREGLPETEAGLTESEVQLREENATLRAEVKATQDKVATLDERFRKSVELTQRINASMEEAESRATQEVQDLRQQLEEQRVKHADQIRQLSEEHLAAYKAAKVEGLANGRELLGLLEDVTSQAAVDDVVRRRGRAEVGDGDLREMRRHLQRGRGDVQDLSEDRQPKAGGSGQTDEFGVPWSNMQKLAGII